MVGWTTAKARGVVVGERHAVSLKCMTADFGDELVLVLGAGLEPAVAMKHLVHVLGARLGIRL